MKSKTKITKQIDRKNNFGLVETVRIAKKNEAWIKVADLLSRPRRKRICVNLEDLNENYKKVVKEFLCLVKFYLKDLLIKK